MAKRISIKLSAFFTILSLPLILSAQQRTLPFISPEVHADKTVTFRLRAPNAKEVKLDSQISGRSRPSLLDILVMNFRFGIAFNVILYQNAGIIRGAIIDDNDFVGPFREILV